MLKISQGTRFKTLNPTNGYGYASENVFGSLRRLGYHVEQNDATADVEIWFDQPQHWDFTTGPYRIGYHPWESTELKPGWAEKMNQCDEIWTPSPLIAEWYTKYAGITVPVYVYEHGVDNIWTPSIRKVDDTIRFLHIGTEAVRKGGPETMRAFRLAFPNKQGVGLTMKMIADGWNYPEFNGVRVVNRTLGIKELVALYHEHHIFVYPSWGEGFGLTPLQAMATGMPTIIPPAWAPYKDYVIPELVISSAMTESPWPNTHPGMMLKPDLDQMVDVMRYARENYEDLQRTSHALISEITGKYSWDRMTDRVMRDLSERLENS